jgi:hypothetical protein
MKDNQKHLFVQCYVSSREKSRLKWNGYVNVMGRPLGKLPPVRFGDIRRL